MIRLNSRKKERIYMKYQRGDICYYDFGKQVSCVQGGVRPCVIVGNNYQNKASSICVVVPITTAKKKELPTHIFLTPNESSKDKISGTILCEQLITVNQLDLKRTGESLNDETLQRVNQALAVELNLTYHHKQEKHDFIEALHYMKETIKKQRRQIEKLKNLLQKNEKTNENKLQKQLIKKRR